MGTTTAPIGQPEWANRGKPPLAAMTVATEGEIDSMSVIKQVQDIGGMRKQNGEPARLSWRNASDVGPVRRRIVQADNAQLT